ncbi:hypothetical protein [Amycolatopsis sp. DSM 110486]|uniref:hypothetical protein n=1 Tax=Amycolatopsis sp. DSM 110486 TaxID=2865832 RepID=UPI001C6A41C6|nr:hypothetical protein [Amycolatopsis sp. DSM 110486]QYN17464.1 hypothetical protein K1T34_32270 [Amycolatopsis sp. DSM 110486]
MRRTAFALTVVAACLACAEPAASAATTTTAASATCNGLTTVDYSPGIHDWAGDTTTRVETDLSCNAADPGAYSVSTVSTTAENTSCLDPGAVTGARYWVVWGDETTSELETPGAATARGIGGVAVETGIVLDGRFAGHSYSLTLNFAPYDARECNSPSGLTRAMGAASLVIA